MTKLHAKYCNIAFVVIIWAFIVYTVDQYRAIVGKMSPLIDRAIFQAKTLSMLGKNVANIGLLLRLIYGYY